MDFQLHQIQILSRLITLLAVILFTMRIVTTIVPPQIKWIEIPSRLMIKKQLLFMKNHTNPALSKIIVWCGMIKKCSELAELWRKHFQDFMFPLIPAKIQVVFQNIVKRKERNFILCFQTSKDLISKI